MIIVSWGNMEGIVGRTARGLWEELRGGCGKNREGVRTPTCVKAVHDGSSGHPVGFSPLA